MLKVYGVSGELLQVQSFYVDSRSCARVGMDMSEWFPVNVGLRQGCVMSPWLCNIHLLYMMRLGCTKKCAHDAVGID